MSLEEAVAPAQPSRRDADLLINHPTQDVQWSADLQCHSVWVPSNANKTMKEKLQEVYDRKMQRKEEMEEGVHCKPIVT